MDFLRKSVTIHMDPHAEWVAMRVITCLVHKSYPVYTNPDISLGTGTERFQSVKVFTSMSRSFFSVRNLLISNRFRVERQRYWSLLNFCYSAEMHISKCTRAWLHLSTHVYVNASQWNCVHVSMQAWLPRQWRRNSNDLQ